MSSELPKSAALGEQHDTLVPMSAVGLAAPTLPPPMTANFAEDASAEAATPGRVIKRYSNRKLYDTKSSRYVTLPQIADLVRSGEHVQIVDNRTKEDKTEVTLALIISEELRVSPRGIPLATLTALITRQTNALLTLPDPTKIQGMEAEIHRLNDRLAELERHLASSRE
jgi:polyhydroxyalkanoate synthesis repressor PhaR